MTDCQWQLITENGMVHLDFQTGEHQLYVLLGGEADIYEALLHMSEERPGWVTEAEASPE